MKKINFKIDMAFIFAMAFFVALCFVCGCAPKKAIDNERISITGTHPVIIEQDYTNENGNILYSSRIEIKPK